MAAVHRKVNILPTFFSPTLLLLINSNSVYLMQCNNMVTFYEPGLIKLFAAAQDGAQLLYWRRIWIFHEYKHMFSLPASVLITLCVERLSKNNNVPINLLLYLEEHNPRWPKSTTYMHVCISVCRQVKHTSGVLFEGNYCFDIKYEQTLGCGLFSKGCLIIQNWFHLSSF